MVGHLLGDYPAGVAEITPTVKLGVAVDKLTVPAGTGDADAVIMPWNGREVADHHHLVLRIVSFAHEGQDGVLHVVKVDPLEALVRGVLLPERRSSPVDAIEVLDEVLKATMQRPFQQVPVER